MERFLFKMSWLWVAIALIQMSGCKGCLEKERIGLLEVKAFFESFHGKDYVNCLLSSWIDDKMSDCCDWEGLKCNATTRRVIELSLSFVPSLYRKVEGYTIEYHPRMTVAALYQQNEGCKMSRLYHPGQFISDDKYLMLNLSLFHPFEELQRLDLSSNQFGSCEKNKAYDGFGSLKRLEMLDLSCNAFESSLGPCLSTLTSLTTLFLQASFQIGVHLKGLEHLTNLEMLDLSENYYIIHSLQRRSVLTKLKKLKVLDLSSTLGLNESYWSYLGALTSLRTLILREIGGNIGTSAEKHWLIGLANLTKLEVLDLGGNHINGNHLPYLSTISSLRTLILRFNDIGGFKYSPGIFENFTNLEILDLSYNNMSGSLRELGLCELKNLVELDLIENNFDSQLPQCLINLVHLRVLNFSSNKLCGNLPSFIANLTSLEHLDLSHNNFEGPFSFSIFANLSKLQVLKLSQNHALQLQTETLIPTYQLRALQLRNLNLHTIPGFLLYQYDLHSIDLSHNKLVGPFPSWLLENNTMLEDMYLMNNSFTGNLQLPNSKRNLLNLDISHNNFSGQLPKNMGRIFLDLEFINMSENSFEGEIPSSMGEMNKLEKLDLSRNNFSGELPRSFVSGCFSLTFLKLSYNNFHGKIFPTYMNMSQLQWLFLDNNHFTGKMGDRIVKAKISLMLLDISNNKVNGQIPHWIGCFVALRILLMSKNLLEGNIPSQLSNLNYLIILDLSQNILSGPIGTSLDISSLRYLDMQNNELNGTIPDTLFRRTQLEVLDFTNNKFSGSIPCGIEEAFNLHILLLGRNRLQGQIPYRLCQLGPLGILDLSHNRFTGPIPLCFNNISLWTGGSHVFHSYFYIYTNFFDIDCHSGYLVAGQYTEVCASIGNLIGAEFMTKNRHELYQGIILMYMRGLDLSSNELSGEIPSTIGDLQTILALNLSNNSLSGSIPKGFSNLKKIESLDLSYNKLSGPIPPSLVELNFLGTFNVSYNNLSGATPNQGQFANFDESNYRGNPNLCGPLIKKSCDVPTPPSSPLSGGEEDEFAVDMVAFYWSFVGSFVTIILGFVVILWINSYWRMRWFRFIDACISSCFYWL